MAQSAARQALSGGKAESILAAAKRAFLADGYGAVSMDLIAREAGVSKATVYAHFAGKEDLFGAVIEGECESYFASFSAGELDPGDMRASLEILGRRFLDLVLSPDAIALHRIILAEVTRFPALGEVFWRSGPERERLQIEGFLKSGVAAGSLSLRDPRRGAEQFLSLVRGEIHLRQVLCLDPAAGEVGIREAVANAVDTFLRAFGGQSSPGGGPSPQPSLQKRRESETRGSPGRARGGG
jgi:TetR/AcrR family transcriptional regulator, mexJK operon transcriptional repressor